MIPYAAIEVFSVTDFIRIRIRVHARHRSGPIAGDVPLLRGEIKLVSARRIVAVTGAPHPAGACRRLSSINRRMRPLNERRAPDGFRAGLSTCKGCSLLASEKWSRFIEQLSPIYKWTAGWLVQVQSCPRRRSALATNRPARWTTRGAPRKSCYAARAIVGNVPKYFSSGVSRSRRECGRCVLYQAK